MTVNTVKTKKKIQSIQIRNERGEATVQCLKEYRWKKKVAKRMREQWLSHF